MSDKPSAAWYLAPIFLGIIGSGIMWYVLKDVDHPDARKMIKKGWVIGIIFTLIDLAWWIPFMLIPFAFMGVDHQQIEQQMEQQTQPRIGQQALQQVPAPGFEDVPEMIVEEPVQQQVPAPGFDDIPEMIVESELDCDPSYPDVCIDPYPPDLDCGEIRYTNFKVLQDDPHGFDGDKDGIGCES